MRSRLLTRIVTFLKGASHHDSTFKKSIFDDIVQLTKGNASIAFDIGAHHGRYSTELIKRISLKRIFCFEPFPESFNVLKQNLTDSVFHHQQLALSDLTGTATFHINFFDETNSLLPSSLTGSDIDHLTAQVRTTEVEVETIENFCRVNSIKEIDILKIDVQG